jgi:hypothetical protein
LGQPDVGILTSIAVQLIDAIVGQQKSEEEKAVLSKIKTNLDTLRNEGKITTIGPTSGDQAPADPSKRRRTG